MRQIPPLDGVHIGAVHDIPAAAERHGVRIQHVSVKSKKSGAGEDVEYLAA